MSSQFRTT